MACAVLSLVAFWAAEAALAAYTYWKTVKHGTDPRGAWRSYGNRAGRSESKGDEK
jgi:steroid 5-alpha reductase family enzyme